MRSRVAVVTSLDEHAAKARLEALLSSAGVTFRVEAGAIRSVDTPMAILGTDARIYSRRNWLGLNPFAFISSISASLIPEPATGGTRVVLEIDPLRAYAWVVFWCGLAAIVGIAMPQPTGVMVGAAVAAASWLFLVRILANHLVRAEIGSALTGLP